jgi:hypothetical protein
MCRRVLKLLEFGLIVGGQERKRVGVAAALRPYSCVDRG